MAGRPKLDKVRARELRDQGWTLQRIAQEFGCTKMAVHLSLKRVVSRTNTVRGERPCLCGCGSLVHEPRKYASADCFMRHVSGGHEYIEWRHGQRLARKVVAATGFILEPDHVVHHVDHDNRNNHLWNLWVFATQAEHTSFHKGGKGRPIWCGNPAEVAA